MKRRISHFVFSISFPSWASSSSMLADRQERHQRSFPVLVVFCSCDQLLVGHGQSDSCFDETVQAGKRVILHVAIIQPKGELVNIAANMLLAGMMIDAMQTALKNRPDAFNSVCSDVFPNVLPGAMIDGFVRIDGFVEALIATMFVGMQGRRGLYVAMDFMVKTFALCVRNRLCDSAPSAFAHSDNGRLSDDTASGFHSLINMLIFFFAADICLVDFDDALQNGWVIAARFTEALQEEPSGLLGDSDFLRKLQGRDALAGSDKEIHGVNPFVQRNVGTLEDSAGSDREIFMAWVAAIEATFASRNALPKATRWAHGTVRPAAGFKIASRRFLVREHFEEFESADGDFAHEAIMQLPVKRQL